jgi:hypothetical protein
MTAFTATVSILTAGTLAALLSTTNFGIQLALAILAIVQA